MPVSDGTAEVAIDVVVAMHVNVAENAMVAMNLDRRDDRDCSDVCDDLEMKEMVNGDRSEMVTGRYADRMELIYA